MRPNSAKTGPKPGDSQPVLGRSPLGREEEEGALYPSDGAIISLTENGVADVPCYEVALAADKNPLSRPSEGVSAGKRTLEIARVLPDGGMGTANCARTVLRRGSEKRYPQGAPNSRSLRATGRKTPNPGQGLLRCGDVEPNPGHRQRFGFGRGDGNYAAGCRPLCLGAEGSEAVLSELPRSRAI